MGTAITALGEGAWEHIVTRYTAYLGSIGRAYRLSSEEIADAVQETWLRAVTNLHIWVRSANPLRDPGATPGMMNTSPSGKAGPAELPEPQIHAAASAPKCSRGPIASRDPWRTATPFSCVGTGSHGRVRTL